MDDVEIFNIIIPFIPVKSKPDKGEIDVYFGIISPKKWQVIDDSYLYDIFVVCGTFTELAKSLNSHKQVEVFYKSPTTENLPEEFNYYNIFEVSTGSDINYKLNQLETQLQYVITRQIKRDNQEFFLNDKKNSDQPKRYAKYIGKRAIKLFSFCGLIFAKDYLEVHKKIIDLINENGGLTRPCLFKMLKENRFLYMKSKLFSERLEILESEKSTL
jgi:hypothetical protein